MKQLYIIVLFAFSNGVSGQLLGQIQNFDCNTFDPIFEDGKIRHEETGMPPFSISVHTAEGHFASSVRTGQALSVHLSSDTTTFVSFLLEARFITGGMSHPIARWNPGPMISLKTCGTDEGAAVVAVDGEDKNEVVATWIAPERLGQAIEFSAVVMDKDGKFWKDVHSEAITAVRDSVAEEQEMNLSHDVDPHNAVVEEEATIRRMKKFNEMKDSEDSESEGKWQMEVMAEKKKQEEMLEWERTQYELRVTQLERQQQERMHVEIMDKERYQIEQYEPEIIKQKEPAKPKVVQDQDKETSAGSCVGLSLSIVCIAIARYLF